MCDDIILPRFLCRYHRTVVNAEDNIPLDTWMENNIPEDYRVVSVMMDKIITDEISFNYIILLEIKTSGD